MGISAQSALQEAAKEGPGHPAHTCPSPEPRPAPPLCKQRLQPICWVWVSLSLCQQPLGRPRVRAVTWAGLEPRTAEARQTHVLLHLCPLQPRGEGAGLLSKPTALLTVWPELGSPNAKLKSPKVDRADSDASKATSSGQGHSQARSTPMGSWSLGVGRHTLLLRRRPLPSISLASGRTDRRTPASTLLCQVRADSPAAQLDRGLPVGGAELGGGAEGGRPVTESMAWVKDAPNACGLRTGGTHVSGAGQGGEGASPAGAASPAPQDMPVLPWVSWGRKGLQSEGHTSRTRTWLPHPWQAQGPSEAIPPLPGTAAQASLPGPASLPGSLLTWGVLGQPLTCSHLSWVCPHAAVTGLHGHSPLSSSPLGTQKTLANIC